MDKNSFNNIRHKKAVALQYNSSFMAPKVVAQGKGHLAQRIIDTAVQSEVTVYENSELANELLNVPLGGSIPPELYEVVAQVLVFVSDLDKLQGLRK